MVPQLCAKNIAPIINPIYATARVAMRQPDGRLLDLSPRLFSSSSRDSSFCSLEVNLTSNLSSPDAGHGRNPSGLTQRAKFFSIIQSKICGRAGRHRTLESRLPWQATGCKAFPVSCQWKNYKIVHPIEIHPNFLFRQVFALVSLGNYS